MALVLPPKLAAGSEGQGRSTWLEGLPATVAALERRWSLELGEPFLPGGSCAWVAPAGSADFGNVVLKVAWPHPEAEHEAAGLRAWNGAGAVRLYACEEVDGSVALLLERCSPGTALADRPEPEQDTVIAALLRRLWLAPQPGHCFRSLQVMCDAWADGAEARQRAGRSSIDPGLARDGTALFRALPGSAARAVLLCTDLHAGNVLAAERKPWLAIDPKPYVGDPTYDPLQHMLNCEERLHCDPRALARRMADLLDLDGERLLLWLFARCVLESVDQPALAEVARRLAPT